VWDSVWLQHLVLGKGVVSVHLQTPLFSSFSYSPVGHGKLLALSGLYSVYFWNDFRGWLLGNLRSPIVPLPCDLSVVWFGNGDVLVRSGQGFGSITEVLFQEFWA
jgi:hypothetical protein